jgi:hypothetical protein
MVNNLMRYWVNACDKVATVYSLYSDDIRFNQYYENTPNTGGVRHSLTLEA